MIAEFEKNLLDMTEGCRIDMHEPDEQGLKARIVGTRLDNAFGEDINAERLSLGHNEIVVILERDYGPKGGGLVVEKFNLATLLALARFGAEYDQKYGILG